MNSNSYNDSVHGAATGTPHPAAAVEPRAGLPAHVQRSELLVPGTQMSGQVPETAPNLQSALLAAVRRRWFAALSLGLIGALAVGGGAWFILPMTYTAVSELHVKSLPQKIMFSTGADESRQAFKTYLESQSRFIKGPFVLSAALRKDGISKLSTIRDEPLPQEWLEGSLSVSNPAVEFIRISLSGQRPEDLAKLVNAVTDAYVEDVANAETLKRRRRQAELERVLGTMLAKITNLNDRLRRIAKETGHSTTEALALAEQLNNQYVSQLLKELTTLRFEQMRDEIELSARSAEVDPTDDEEALRTLVDKELLKDPEIIRGQARIEAAKTAIEQNETITKNKESPLLVKLRKELEAAKTDLENSKNRIRNSMTERIKEIVKSQSNATLNQLKQRIQTSKAHIDRLDEQLRKQEGQRKESGLWSVELLMLQKDLTQTETLSQQISAEVEKLKVESSNEARVTLYRQAEVPHKPDLSKKLKLVGASGVGTMLLIAAGIIWLDVRTRRINSLDEVVTGLRLPVLGSLPVVPRQGTGSRSRRRSNKEAVWQGSLMESVDSARVMLLRRAHLENAKVAMVVSAMSSEGKTTLSCHLATSLARAGYRTLLIDADIRRPTVHRVFEIPNEPGLCALLSHETDLASAVVPTSQDGLFALPAGTLSADTLRELAQDTLGPILAQLRDQFDFIIVDSSPILPVTDSLLISQWVDGVIFSIRRDISQYPKVSAACQRLAMMGIPLWGAVVIGLDQMSYGYRYAYPYASSSAN